ncbi:c-type cytochrome [Hoeflea poritis]|uniref:Cytochrome c family protein n=1 Tax=Hoeflea poritis TaxID=2993659 RepID=A0ABT4VT86_9HYPH|nr:cytochrome c family protein [Hoeflea poritis]MDA4847925.1 cytochrome c family protein [Hoeflea poritis]
MNSSFFNAAAGAFLAVAFVVMTVSIASDAIFHSGEPEAEGYALEVREGTAATAAAAEEEALEPISPLLASASIEGGQKAFRKCAACHTVENGGANRVGPNLWDVVDRPVAAAAGFGYSTAMQDYSEGGEKKWEYENLNAFLEAPRRYMRGTAMGFAGVKKADERADLIAYMRSLSDSPAPLPSEADMAPAAEATEPATEEAAVSDTAPASEDAAASDAEKPAMTDDASTGDAETPAATEESSAGEEDKPEGTATE